MRIGIAVLLLCVGLVAGFAVGSEGGGTPVQAQAMLPTPEARFLLGPQEVVQVHGSTGTPSTKFIHFMLDKRTKDCFLVTTGTTGLFTAVTPVHSGSCEGF
jgi:hypothetical protein